MFVVSMRPLNTRCNEAKRQISRGFATGGFINTLCWGGGSCEQTWYRWIHKLSAQLQAQVGTLFSSFRDPDRLVIAHPSWNASAYSVSPSTKYVGFFEVASNTVVEIPSESSWFRSFVSCGELILTWVTSLKVFHLPFTLQNMAKSSTEQEFF